MLSPQAQLSCSGPRAFMLRRACSGPQAKRSSVAPTDERGSATLRVSTSIIVGGWGMRTLPWSPARLQGSFPSLTPGGQGCCTGSHTSGQRHRGQSLPPSAAVHWVQAHCHPPFQHSRPPAHPIHMHNQAHAAARRQWFTGSRCKIHWIKVQGSLDQGARLTGSKCKVHRIKVQETTGRPPIK
eukprot:364935-Chlamydomonas_euryale.AAC.17